MCVCVCVCDLFSAAVIYTGGNTPGCSVISSDMTSSVEIYVWLISKALVFLLSIVNRCVQNCVGSHFNITTIMLCREIILGGEC